MNDDDLRWLAGHEPETPEPTSLATDRARIALLEHAAVRPPRRGVRIARRMILLGAAAAVTAGVVMTATNPATTPTPSRHHAQAAAPSPLLKLAARVTAAPAPPGDATLVVRHHTFPNAKAFWGYDLYEDGGDTFYGSTEAELRAAMSGPENGNPKGGAVVRAAAASATATPAEARERVLAAAPVPKADGAAPAVAAMKAAREKKLGPGPTPTPITDRERADNYLWMNAIEAITAGAGRADVRAGAMQALSTIAAVTVHEAPFDGQPVLEVTDTDFPDGYAETMMLDTRTGVLVHFRGGTADQADVDVTYDIKRVKLPGLEAARR